MIFKYLIPFVISQADTNQHYMTRANAAVLIGKLSLSSYALPASIIELSLRLCRDPNEKIRLKISEQLPLIRKKFNNDYEAAICQELLSLINDRVIDVKLTSIRSCIDIGESLSENNSNEFINTIIND